MAKTIEEKISELETKLKQAKALVAKKQAAEKAKIENEKRRFETRKRVLVGAFILQVMEKYGVDPSILTYNSKSFDDWLKRPDERAIFGLPIIKKEGQKID